LDQRAVLSVALIGIAVAACVVVAAGIGASPIRHGDEVIAESTALSDVATPDELKLWNRIGCATCHGGEARGTQMGPDLTKIVPLYLARYGSAEAAKEKLVAYLLDPKTEPKLRDDGATYVNPMPAIDRLAGGRREDAPGIAELLLRLAR
jgi:hypothetical protein